MKDDTLLIILGSVAAILLLGDKGLFGLRRTAAGITGSTGNLAGALQDVTGAANTVTGGLQDLVDFGFGLFGSGPEADRYSIWNWLPGAPEVTSYEGVPGPGGTSGGGGATGTW